MVYNNKMIKSNMYTENNIILSSTRTRSRLACNFLCEKNNACSMMVVRPIDNDKVHVQCENYEIVNYYNLTSKDHFGIETWYKQEIFLKMFEGKDGTEMTTPTPCPSPFTLLNAGCYFYNVTNVLRWNKALYECSNLGPPDGTCSLGQFSGYEVSDKALLYSFL